MNLLILGGTRFVGRHITAAALERGHKVTLFNRGQTDPALFPEAEHLRGDRDGGLGALVGRQWDAVIDVNGYVPRLVRDMAQLLADNVGRYVFISSLSAYKTLAEPGVNEDFPLATLEDETVEEIRGDTYGGLKALCEKAAEAAMPGRVLTTRPGFVGGPHDHTDRLPSWINRAAQGGDMLIPWDIDENIQFIDGRDLAEWTIRMTEEQQVGAYSATGPDYGLTMQTFFETCVAVGDADTNLIWPGRAFCAKQGVTGDGSVPLWSELPGMFYADCSKAIAAGLTFRPLEVTISDTLTWINARPTDHEWRAGLNPQREKQLLDAWRNR